jgi:hypothetical protein
MEIRLFTALCMVACAFLVYFMVHIHKELRRSGGNRNRTIGIDRAHAAVLQMRFAVGHKGTLVSKGNGNSAKRPGDLRDVVQLELPDLGPIPLMTNQGRR